MYAPDLELEGNERVLCLHRLHVWCEPAPAFVIPSEDFALPGKIEYIEKFVIREYIGTRIHACSLEN